jgi:hypothetical protein
MSYAARSKVPIDRSRAEIEKVLTRYKADQFGSAIDNDAHRAMVQFRCQQRLIRFEMELPTQDQKLRSRWRGLVLAIKAKLESVESVESGIETFEEAFLAHVVMPNGQTFGRVAIPEIQKAIDSGKMPQNLIEWKNEQ